MQNHRGNALFLILIAVALFAALSYAITSSGRGGGSIDREQATISGSEIIQYAGQIQNAVNKLKIIGGCSDTNISFESLETGTLLENTFDPTGDERCHVFSNDGGGVTYREFNDQILDNANSASKYYSQPVFVGTTHITDVGTDGGAEASKELMMFIPFLKESVCKEIANKTVGLNNDGGVPKDNNIAYNVTETSSSYFKGQYTNPGGFGLVGEGSSSPTPSTIFHGTYTGCFEGKNLPPAGTYHFYQVLIAR